MPKRLLEPVHDKILVKLMPPPETTTGGILIPEKQRQLTPEGIVVAVGPGHLLQDGTRVPVCVKIGDKVLLPQSHPFYFDFDQYVMLRDEEVPAIIRDPQPEPETKATPEG